MKKLYRGSAQLYGFCSFACRLIIIIFTLICVDRQRHTRFCRAEIPSYRVKALENTQSILSL